MNKVKIPDTRIDKRFKWSQSHSLKNTSPQEAILIRSAGTGPNTTHDHQDVPEQKKMALAPDTCGGNDENTSDTHTAQVIAVE